MADSPESGVTPDNSRHLWETVLRDFEDLPPDQYSLVRISAEEMSESGELSSHWLWLKPEDLSLRIQTNAIMLMAAKAAGPQFRRRMG